MTVPKTYAEASIRLTRAVALLVVNLMLVAWLLFDFVGALPLAWMVGAVGFGAMTLTLSAAADLKRQALKDARTPRQLQP